MESRKFRDISGSFATGVTIITTKNEEGVPVGMTANSFTSLSLDPPLVLINVDKKSSLYSAFIQAESFAVNILSSSQEELSRRFSTRNIDRFEGVGFEEDATGAPILPNVIGYFDCEKVQQYDGGDHVIIIGKTKSGEVREGEPLLFFKGKYRNIDSRLIKQ